MANLSSKDINHIINKKYIIDKYIQLSNELHKLPSAADVEKCDYLPSVYYIRKEFGTMENLHKLSGVNNEFIKFNRTTKSNYEERKNKVAKRYLKLCDELGRLATTVEIRKYKYMSHQSIGKYFESIKDLQKYSGAYDKYGLFKGETDEEIKQEIINTYIKLCDEIGSVATREDIKNCENICSYDYIRKYIGSMRELKRLSSVKNRFSQENKRKKSTKKNKPVYSKEKELIEKVLMELRLEKGERLDAQEINACLNIPSVEDIKRIYKKKSLIQIWAEIENRMNSNNLIQK